jgi:hypothetical protein
LCLCRRYLTYWPERVNNTKLEEVMRNLMNEKVKLGNGI